MPEPEEWLVAPGVIWCMVTGGIEHRQEHYTYDKGCQGPHRSVAIWASKTEYPDFRRVNREKAADG